MKLRSREFHFRLAHWSMSLPDICIRPSHSVVTKCHHKIYWRHNLTCCPTQLSRYWSGIQQCLLLVNPKQVIDLLILTKLCWSTYCRWQKQD